MGGVTSNVYNAGNGGVQCDGVPEGDGDGRGLDGVNGVRREV